MLHTTLSSLLEFILFSEEKLFSRVNTEVSCTPYYIHWSSRVVVFMMCLSIRYIQLSLPG